MKGVPLVADPHGQLQKELYHFRADKKKIKMMADHPMNEEPKQVHQYNGFDFQR